MPCSVRVTAPAKLNLHLKVLPKRADGFHDIESIFQKVPLYDELLIEMVDKNYECQVVSPDFVLPQENTLTLAYKAFKSLTGISKGVKVLLKKQIPSGAGMGGGSSDAAAMLRGLQKLFNISLDEVQLQNAASKIGSDVFFFLSDEVVNSTALVTGRGENVDYIKSRRDLSYVLVCPGVHSSTKEAYGLVDDWNNGSMTEFPMLNKLEFIYDGSVKNWSFNNSFTEPLVQKYPEIENALRDVRLTGADFVQMTGSGSVVFGVFESEEDSKKAYTQLCQTWKGCYILTSSLFQKYCSICSFQEG